MYTPLFFARVYTQSIKDESQQNSQQGRAPADLVAQSGPGSFQTLDRGLSRDIRLLLGHRNQEYLQEIERIPPRQSRSERRVGRCNSKFETEQRATREQLCRSALLVRIIGH